MNTDELIEQSIPGIVADGEPGAMLYAFEIADALGVQTNTVCLWARNQRVRLLRGGKRRAQQTRSVWRQILEGEIRARFQKTAA